MEQNRNLQPLQFYHSSYEDLKPGAILEPSHKSNYPQEERWRTSRVWMASSPEHAEEWSTGGSNIYHVQPDNPELHTDLTDFDHNAMPSAGAIFNQYHASSAKVIRKL